MTIILINVIVDWHKQLIVLLKLPTLPSAPSAIMKAVAKNKEKNFFHATLKMKLLFCSLDEYGLTLNIDRAFH